MLDRVHPYIRGRNGERARIMRDRDPREARRHRFAAYAMRAQREGTLLVRLVIAKVFRDLVRYSGSGAFAAALVLKLVLWFASACVYVICRVSGRYADL